MFATLVIQLPSDFRGGQLVLRYHGQKAVYYGGADDASCIDTVHHTAFFADVEHELQPITYGYRIVLVYNLVWNTQGPNLLPNQASITPVTEALRDLTKNAPCNAWMLAMPLKHEYTMSSVEKFGIRSLKNHDASRVDVLRLAGKQINAGELEVVVCLLKSNGTEQCFDEEGTHAWKGILRLYKAYKTDASKFPYNLSFVNFMNVSKDWNLALERRSEPKYTGNEGAMCETTYRAVITLMWPREKGLEVLSSDKQNLQRILQEPSEEEDQPKIDRILEWYGATRNGVSVEKAEILMNNCQACSKGQAPIAIELVLGHLENNHIRKPATGLITRFGWDCFAKLLEKIFCPARFNGTKNTKGPLATLRDLGILVPQEVRVKGIERAMKFLLCQQKIFEKSPIEHASYERGTWENEKKLVVEVCVVILDILVVARAEMDDQCKQKVDALIGKAFQTWKESSEQFLTPLNELVEDWKPADTSDLVEKIKTELKSLAQTAQVTRFRSECQYIVSHLRPPPPKNAQKNFFETWIGCKRKNSYESFVRLAFHVMSQEKVAADVFDMYKKFVSLVPSLCADSVKSIASIVEDVRSTKDCEMPYLHGTVMYMKEKEDVKSLKQTERNMVEATAEEPPEARRVYADKSTGISELDEFLRSQEMEMRLELEVKDGTDMREKFANVQQALPRRSECGGWQEDDVLQIDIAKPSIQTHRRRQRYERNLKTLEEVRQNLRDLESRKRSLPDADVIESLAKQARTGDSQVMRKVYKM